MTLNAQLLNQKIDAVVAKLFALDETSDDLLSKEGGEKAGVIRRDFGIREWDWPQGVGLYGLSKLSAYRQDGKFDAFIEKWYADNMAIGLPSRNINTTAPLITLVDLLDQKPYQKYESLCLDWAQWLIDCLPRTKEGGFQHVTSAIGDRQGVRLNAGEMWIDTLFMAVLFLNKMGRRYQNPQWISEGIKQVLMHIKYLYDDKTGLFYHGWTFRGNHNFGGIFWCRGNSWFTFGIMDYIEDFGPDMDKGLKSYLIDTYRAQVDALIRVQAPSGLWHTVLLEDDSYEEVSGSAAIVTGILKGIRLGILDDSYLPAARRAVCAICENIAADGTVLNVSGGTGMGENAQHYKNIIIAPMAYGQSLTLVALCEALRSAA